MLLMTCLRAGLTHPCSKIHCNGQRPFCACISELTLEVAVSAREVVHCLVLSTDVRSSKTQLGNITNEVEGNNNVVA